MAGGGGELAREAVVVGGLQQRCRLFWSATVSMADKHSGKPRRERSTVKHPASESPRGLPLTAFVRVSVASGEGAAAIIPDCWRAQLKPLPRRSLAQSLSLAMASRRSDCDG
jgi:hypothetical protein